jgi:hypothetical protein
MTITTTIQTPTIAVKKIHEIRIVEHRGSQSSEHAVHLYSDGKEVERVDVRSIEDGIHYLHDLLKREAVKKTEAQFS